jgi:type I restriction enzyme, R subunit
MDKKDTLAHIKLDERNHVEKPLLDQLQGLGWEVLDLDSKQQPADSFRDSFTEVVMLPMLREQLTRINDWMESDQVEEVVKQLTACFPTNNLVENNRHLLELLLENTSVSENRHTGENSPTVRFIDFENDPLNNNRFIAVCQFKVRILGTEHHIIPDIVLFVNGLPLVLIECKSPKVKDPIAEAIDQMLRYSEQRGAKGEGSAPLFFYNQFIISTCRQQAKFGTITTHNEKHFYRWADPFPRTVDELDHGAGTANDQQRLVAGMCDPNNLLEIVRSFTLFSTNDKGETIKIVGRYQQFRAVKLAVQRLLDGKTPRERSGIIWHTQGSGKSLTMMFMVRAMYRHNALQQWKVVFVTDRTQLEQQLAETSQSIGFSVKVADSIRKLKELLRSDSSDLVMAMIHKFREVDLAESFPELNPSPNILVMTDEAHRSQYSMLGANLDKGIPNSARIGYTGTPIDKTERVFGDYIDKYTMRQSIEDGVTLEIVYEGRTHNAEISDQKAMDTAFTDVFSEYELGERLEILGYGSRDAYLEAEPTIVAKAKDMLNHYLEHVYPNSFKAQVVATSREAAVRYKEHLDAALVDSIAALEQSNPLNLDIERLRQLETDVIISAGHNDLPRLKQYGDKSRHETSIKRFKMRFGSEDEGLDGNLGIVIVNNMLLTGFDAPVEQVMYLDKVVVAHNLLQAIARVNRVGDASKDKGFVVDYVGIGHHLKKALDNYDEREQKEVEAALSFPEDELRELESNHRAILELLEKHGLHDLTDHDAFFDIFYDEDLRFEFMSLFKQFTRSLNLVFPAKQALEFMGDYSALTEINVLAGKHFRDARLSMKGIPTKLRALTDEYLASKGIVVKIEPISILDEDFESHVEKRSRTKTKAAEIEHAVRHHLDVDLDDDPDLQASFAEALAAILEEFRDNWQRIYEELEKLRERIRAASKEPTYGLHRKKQMPFFRMFRRELEAAWEEHPGYGDNEDEQISLLVNLTQQVFNVIERELKLTGFWESIPARNRLRAELQKTLLRPDFQKMPDIVTNRAHLISRTMEIAQKNNDVIVYADQETGVSAPLIELNSEFHQWLVEQNIWSERVTKEGNVGSGAAMPGSTTVSFLVVKNSEDLTEATVTSIDLKRLFSVPPTTAVSITIGGDIYAIANETSGLTIGFLTAGVLLAAYHAVRDYAKEVFNHHYAAVLVALKDFHHPTSMSKESLYIKTNMLLEAEGEDAISEKKIEKILHRLSCDLKCIEMDLEGNVSLKEKVRYR